MLIIMTAHGGVESDAAPMSLRSAEKAIGTLDKAFKAFQLYPEHHDICQSGLAIAKSALDAVLNAHSTLKVSVEKERFLLGGEVVYTSLSDEGLSALLYRDGILWIEFRKGLQSDEIKGFLDILKTYRHQEEETEGDVVTALWENDFRHIRYEAREVFWETDPLVGFSLPHLSGNEGTPPPDQDAGDGEGEREAVAGSEPPSENAALSIVAKDKPDAWALTPEEENILRQMVFEQENLESLDAAIEVLVLILRDKTITGEKKHEDIAVILAFLKDTLQDTFIHEAFSTGLKMLKRLDQVRSIYKEAAPRSVRLIDNFFHDISSPVFLESLTLLWPRLEALDNRRIRPVKEVLLLLHPRSIAALLPMRLRSSSEKIRELLLQIIVSLARSDLTPLETLADGEDEEAALEVLRILGRLDDPGAEELLYKMARHSHKNVRRDAIFQLLQKNPDAIKRLFPMIDDADEGIRTFMIGTLGKRRQRLAEDLLRGYLEHHLYQCRDVEHLLACFHALGRCGSDLSIPFLERTLMGRRFISVAGLDRLTQRTGAVLALLSLETAAAKTVLEKAANSKTPGIRLAYKRAMERRDGR